MTKRSTPPFQHTPYDGSSQPFTVGLKPLEEMEFLEPDRHLGRYLAEKKRLFADRLETVFRAEPDTDAAQQEVLDLIADNLQRFHCRTHRFHVGGVSVSGSSGDVSLGDRPALLTASRLVQEDLVLMRPGPGGYRLAAASLCFPSSWSLAEKFGQTMSGIHETVPGFNNSRMGQMVARLFDNLKAGQLVGRFNWSVYPDAQLHHPEPRQVQLDGSDNALARLFIRVERQTLRRLPGTGDILFTIKVHHDPLSALEGLQNCAQLAEGLRQQLLALDADQVNYKGLAENRIALAEALKRLAA
ncbi:heme-dependent oxidative N-demethylase family protein [Roseibium sp.]|uniref:heme-dependent oxidative N-demethylase family protein n=1 Tax=Roseibium sp. TaxID=1936156 RepID=UPI003D0AFD5A